MNKNIDNIKKTRLFLLNAINDLSTDQLNEIPAGFNNNIIWNLGHMIAAQQSICYIRAGVLPVVEKKYITEYKPGTKPEQHVDAAEIQKTTAEWQLICIGHNLKKIHKIKVV